MVKLRTGSNGKAANQLEPFRLVGVEERLAMRRCQLLADLDEIGARVKAGGNVTDFPAQRLAISEMGRARQRVDLRASIIDVVFAGHVPATEIQQASHGVAKHRAARMGRMQRPGRVRRDIFHIHRLAGAAVIPAVIRSGSDDIVDLLRPQARLDANIDETGTGDLDGCDAGNLTDFHTERLGKVARFHTRGFRQHHRGVAGKVSMRCLARQLEHHARRVEIGRQVSRRLHVMNN